MFRILIQQPGKERWRERNLTTTPHVTWPRICPNTSHPICPGLEYVLTLQTPQHLINLTPSDASSFQDLDNLNAHWLCLSVKTQSSKGLAATQPKKRSKNGNHLFSLGLWSFIVFKKWRVLLFFMTVGDYVNYVLH